MKVKVSHCEAFTTFVLWVLVALLAAAILGFKLGYDTERVTVFVVYPLLTSAFVLLLALAVEHEAKQQQARDTELARAERLRRFRGE